MSMSSDELPSEELAVIAQKAARGGMFLLLANASSTVILAVGSIIIARLLGPSNYGSYSLIITVPILLVSVADAGIGSALVRFPAKLRSEGDLYRGNRIIRLGFLFKVCVGIAAFLICYSGSNLIAASILNRVELAPLVQFASALIVCKAVYDAVAYAFIGLDLMQLNGGMQILQSTLKSFIAPLLIMMGFGVAGAVSGYWLSYVVVGIGGSVLLFTNYARSTGRSSASMSTELKTMLTFSLPLYSAILISTFFTQYQNIVLAHFASNLEIGNYNAAANFTMLLTILAYPIGTVMFPMFSKLDPEKSGNGLTKAFELSVKYSSLLIIPATVAAMVFSRELVSVTYGRGYLLAPNFLIAICSIYLLTALSYLVITPFLNGVGGTTIVLKMNIFTLAVCIPLAPLLAWFGGVYGLITASVFANAVGTLYGAHEASVRYRARSNLRANVRILIAAFAAAIPTILLLHVYVSGATIVNLIIGALLYLIAYLTLAPFLGVLNRFDVDNLKTIFYKNPQLRTIMNPILNYESWILSKIGRN